MSIHNTTDSTYQFLYVLEEITAGRFLCLFDKSGYPLSRVYVREDGTYFFGWYSRSELQSAKDWSVALIPSMGAEQFRVALHQEGQIFHIGENTFWLDEEREVFIGFTYYGLQSDLASVPIVPHSANPTPQLP